jgi:hypothetical protein
MEKCSFAKLLKIVISTVWQWKKNIFDRNELWLQAMNTEANVPIVLEFWF